MTSEACRADGHRYLSPDRHLEPRARARQFLLAIENADRVSISALSVYETKLVAMARLGQQGLIELEQLIEAFAFAVVPFDRAQADLSAAPIADLARVPKRGRLSICAIA